MRRVLRCTGGRAPPDRGEAKFYYSNFIADGSCRFVAPQRTLRLQARTGRNDQGNGTCTTWHPGQFAGADNRRDADDRAIIPGEHRIPRLSAQEDQTRPRRQGRGPNGSHCNSCIRYLGNDDRHLARGRWRLDSGSIRQSQKPPR